MTSEEFIIAQRMLGETDDELASIFGVTSRVVRSWSRGTARIPQRHAKIITFLVAAIERERAIDSSGLPRCDWLRAHEYPPPPATADDLIKYWDVRARHSDQCPTCQARAKSLSEQVGPMPAFPIPRGGWLLRPIEWVERVPPIARPAVIGSAVLAIHVPFGVIFSLPRFIKAPSELASAGIGLLIAAAAGAMGGFAYSLTRPTFKRLGRSGDYLTGILCVFAYMTSLALALPFAFGGPLIEGRTGWAIMAIMSIVFGLLITAHVRSESARSV